MCLGINCRFVLSKEENCHHFSSGQCPRTCLCHFTATWFPCYAKISSKALKPWAFSVPLPLNFWLSCCYFCPLISPSNSGFLVVQSESRASSSPHRWHEMHLGLLCRSWSIQPIQTSGFGSRPAFSCVSLKVTHRAAKVCQRLSIPLIVLPSVAGTGL